MFFMTRNLAVQECSALEEPWNFDTSGFPFHLGKADYQKHYANPNADHCLVSLVEGEARTLKTSKSSKEGANPALYVHGLVGDFDGVFTPDLIDQMKANPPTPYKPAWWCLTHSDKLRLFWLFEKPLRVCGSDHARKFLREAAKRINCVRWASGFDPKSTDPWQWFDIGKKWEAFDPDFRVSAMETNLWDFETISREKICGRVSDPEIPFDVIKEEARQRFPGRWKGEWQEGQRCLRFWDPASDNVNGCIMTPKGVRVFVDHDKPFMAWSDIFGRDFTDRFTAARYNTLLEHMWYHSGNQQWWRWVEPARSYQPRTDASIRRDLKVEANLSDKPDKDDGLSEIDKALHYLTTNKEVRLAIPMVYQPHGYVRSIDGPVLNTSTLRVLAPAPSWLPDGEYRWENPEVMRMFPFIYHLIVSMFCRTQGEYDEWAMTGEPWVPREGGQLQRFLSWLSFFYVNSLRLEPRSGHILVAAGEKGTGKTFLFHDVIGTLMGGVGDGTKMLVAGEKFNSSCLEKPLLLVDDEICGMERDEKTKFSNKLKALAATGRVVYEKKFRDSTDGLEWRGRVVILCNTDVHSLSLLPMITDSNKDKIMMLRFGGARSALLDDKDWGRNIRAISSEVSAFARFLAEYQVPDVLTGVSTDARRFGLAGWQHGSMTRAAIASGYAQVVLEAFCHAGAGIPRSLRDDPVNGWTGSPGDLMAILSELSEGMAREIKGSRNLLTHLYTLQGIGMAKLLSEEGAAVTRWLIPYAVTDWATKGNDDGPIT